MMHLAHALASRKIYRTLNGVSANYTRSISTRTKPLLLPPPPPPPPSAQRRTVFSSFSSPFSPFSSSPSSFSSSSFPSSSFSSSAKEIREKAGGYLLWTDASSNGHGGYCFPMSKKYMDGIREKALYPPHEPVSRASRILEYSRPWTRSERLHNINYLEAAATLYGLRLWKSQFRGKEVFAFCDNTTAVNRFRGAARPGDTIGLLRETTQLCAQSNIKFSLQWIPREANRKADSLSRPRRE